MAGDTKKKGLANATPETRTRVARDGGIAVSRDPQHMAEIGRKGGQARSSKNDE